MVIVVAFNPGAGKQCDVVMRELMVFGLIGICHATEQKNSTANKQQT